MSPEELERERLLFEVRVDRALVMLIDSISTKRVTPVQWRRSADQRIYAALSTYERAMKKV